MRGIVIFEGIIALESPNLLLNSNWRVPLH